MANMVPYMASAANQSVFSTEMMITSTAVEGIIQETSMSRFSAQYSEVHGYISGIVCVFGVISNFLNIIVLTRRHMISPTNYILTGLAIADMLTMLTYLVYAVYFYIVKRPSPYYDHSLGWMYFVVTHNLFIITCHNMAMWLTVALAVFRYIFVCHHVLANRLCSLTRAKITIFIVLLATVITCVPNIFLYKVINLEDKYVGQNVTGYWVIDSEFVNTHKHYKTIIFWLYGVVIKVAPCILLTIVSGLIVYAMHQAGKRRQRLLAHSNRQPEHESSEHNRTTIMLIAVVLFFVITEFPQGILAMISGIDGEFFEDVYSNLGDVMDLLVLLNSAVNFVLYCIMSQQFRDTFTNLFLGTECANWRSKKGKQNGSVYTTVQTEATQV